MVPVGGFEPPTRCREQFLRLPRIPFRHAGQRVSRSCDDASCATAARIVYAILARTDKAPWRFAILASLYGRTIRARRVNHMRRIWRCIGDRSRRHGRDEAYDRTRATHLRAWLAASGANRR